MPVFLPLLLVALGSLTLLVMRDGRVVLVGLAAQWLGLIGTIIAGTPAEGNSLGVVGVEGVTLLVCLTVLFITLRSLRNVRLSTLPGLSGERRRLLLRAEDTPPDLPPRWSREGLVDQAWLWGVGLVVGIAGFGLARLYNLGAREDGILAFYWIALSGMVTLVVHGTRDSVKLAAGLIALLNATALALHLLGLSDPGPVALALLSACRIVACLVLAYAWMLLKVTFMSADLGLGALFDGRDGRWGTETALVVSGPVRNVASEDEGAAEEADEAEVAPDAEEVAPGG
ncbi:MAG TPA: hypothetical protein VEY08_05200 [Chloroflexia bacterium]|nr:hypothetical protein [Chloroflexia bacterium]